MNIAPRDWVKAAGLLSAALLIAWLLHSEERLVSGSVDSIPEQSDYAGQPAFNFKGFRLEPTTAYRIEAKILSKKSYRYWTNGGIAPWDFAMGWGPMSHEPFLEQLDISQSGRFYFYRWSGQPPMDPLMMVKSSVNMHLVPADESIGAILDKARAGEAIELEGKLVNIVASNGRRWNTSMTRYDSGAGACEIMFVTSARLRLPS